MEIQRNIYDVHKGAGKALRKRQRLNWALKEGCVLYSTEKRRADRDPQKDSYSEDRDTQLQGGKRGISREMS